MITSAHQPIDARASEVGLLMPGLQVRLNTQEERLRWLRKLVKVGEIARGR
jgi:hypothetical protein